MTYSCPVHCGILIMIPITTRRMGTISGYKMEQLRRWVGDKE